MSDSLDSDYKKVTVNAAQNIRKECYRMKVLGVNGRAVSRFAAETRWGRRRERRGKRRT